MEVPISMAAADRSNCLRVVIADGDTAFAELLARIVDSHDEFEVVGIAKDGEEAVQLTIWQDADIVLIDIDLPKIDGLQAAQLLHQSRPRAFVLLMSSLEDERGKEARKVGAVAYVPKTRVSQLERELVAVVDHGVGARFETRS
jgi:two-component system response regulator (stage 0 sporulation protein A)